MNDLEAARALLSFYETIDGDEFSEDYWIRSDHAATILKDRFINETNPLTTLFMVRCDLQNAVDTLDFTGAAESAQLADDAFKQVDANLRALVAKITQQKVYLPYEPEQKFIDSFIPDDDNVILLKSNIS